MPKKFKENTKAAEAKARKNAIKEEQEHKKQQALEDELWKEDDKHVLKKIQRKEDKDKRKVEQLEKKKELQKLADDEMAQLSKTSAKCPPVKVTRAQIEVNKQAVTKEAPPKRCETPEEPIEENLNRIMFEGAVASNIDEAISVLNGSNDEVDKHPEKRMKAAYLAFEEKMLPQLKAEYPTHRLSQLKQILHKEWLKSPENPVNQALRSSMKR